MSITEARLTAKARKAVAVGDFAGPHRSFPVTDENHFRNALARAHFAPNPNSVRRKATAIAKRKGFIPADYRATEADETDETREAAMDASYDDRRLAIQRQMDAEHAHGDGDADDVYVEYTPCGQVCDVYDTYFIFCLGWRDSYFKRDYTIDDSMTVTLGDESEPVVRKTVYLDLPDADDGEQEAARADGPHTLVYFAEAGQRHSKEDAQHIADAGAHIGQALTHMQHAQGHVTDLGTSMPPAANAYGAGLFPLIQSAREVAVQESVAGENVGIVEVASGGVGTFVEAAADGTKGVIAMTIIRPGFNASRGRYYTKEALAKAHERGTFAGKKMYLNHPTLKEEKDRPERDVRDIGAYILETALGPDGELTGRAQVVNPVLEGLLGKAQGAGLLDKVLGVSINATGRIREGEIEGTRTHIVEEFTQGKSVDFVTEPGAGGRIGLLEANHGPVEQPATEGVRTVTPEEIKALMDEMKAMREANTALTTQVTESRAEATRAQAVARVQGTVAARLAEHKDDELPQIAKKRITLMFERAENAERLEEAITAEIDYVKAVKATAPVAKGGVTGLGARVTEGGTDVIAPSRASDDTAFVESLGRELKHIGGDKTAKDLLRAMAG